MAAPDSKVGTEDIPIQDFLILATAPPDLDLLRRYAIVVSGTDGTDVVITEAECRWVETNISVNPVWRDAWAEIRRQQQKAGSGLRYRGLVVTSAFVAFLVAGWIETLDEVDVSSGLRVEEVIRGRGRITGSIFSQLSAKDARFQVGSTWTLRPTVAVDPADTVMSRLVVSFSESDGPSTRGELALSLGTLNELAGRYDSALTWYEVSEGSGSIEFREAAEAGVSRMRRRTTAHQESKSTYGAQ